MAYIITDMPPNEIATGVFAYKGEVYRIDRDGEVYQWDQHAQLGGFFKKIGKIFKKVAKVAVKVAPVAALAYTGYGFATALQSGMSVGSAASAALTGPSSIIGKVAQGIGYVTGGGGSQPVVVGGGVPGGPNTPVNTSGVSVGNILPAASAAIVAYYNSKASQATQAAQFAQMYPGQPNPYDTPGVNQGLPAYAGAGGMLAPTSEQTPKGIPDVTPTIEKYKTPLLIGMGLIGVALLMRKG